MIPYGFPSRTFREWFNRLYLRGYVECLADHGWTDGKTVKEPA